MMSRNGTDSCDAIFVNIQGLEMQPIDLAGEIQSEATFTL